MLVKALSHLGSKQKIFFFLHLAYGAHRRMKLSMCLSCSCHRRMSKITTQYFTAQFLSYFSSWETPNLNFPDNLETFQTIWKLSRQSGTITGNRKNFQTIRKAYRKSGKFPDSLETYQTIWKKIMTIWKFSRQYRNFLDNLEIFQTFWKLYRQFGNLP